MGYEAWEPDADEIAEVSPSWGVCECCYQTMHHSEFTDPDEDAVVEALVAKHGGPVCNVCADEHHLCRECDEVTNNTHPDLICEDCAAETPQARADARADERAKTFMESRAS